MANFTSIKASGNGWLCDGSMHVPNDPRNRHYQMIQEDIADGAVVDPEFTAAETLTNTRRDLKAAVKAEALSRITAAVPAIDSMQMVDLMVELWPMLNTGSAGPDILQVRDIYVVARSEIIAINSMDQTALDAYDPVTSPTWP